MAYVEVWKSTRLITRRRVDEQKARKGCRVRLGSVGEVRVAIGQSETLGELEVRMFAGEPPPAWQEAKKTASIPPHDDQSLPPLSMEAPSTRAEQMDRYPNIEGYKIIEPLGGGGMGIVWRAEQLSTRRQVALKLMVSHRIDSTKAQARFQREVELTARLDHPNIARIYDSGLHQGMHYYAMELVDGVPLDRYVKGKSLSRTQILALMQKVCQAVLYAHLRAVIHRDLKPSNILVSPDGQSHVLDFGLAKALLEEDDALTISVEGQIAGTPAYMSPEQAAGHHSQTDTRTDVFSLGVILYELLTGQSPHDLSGSMFDVLHQITEGRIRRPREVDKSIDSELEALLLKALAQNPEDRYASAGALAKDITNYLDEEPLDAKVPTILYFLRKKALKYRVQVATGLAVSFVLLGIILVAYTKIVTERAVREAQAVELELKSKKLTWAELELKALGSNQEEAQAALRILRDEYLATQRNVDELQQKLDQRVTPVPNKRINLKQGEPLSLTALVRQPALPKGVQSWTLEMTGHHGFVCKVAYSPDGCWLASGSHDGTVRLWDSESSQLKKILIDPNSSISDFSWSPDSKRLMSASLGNDNIVRLWDPELGKIERTFVLEDKPIRCATWSPDGRFIAYSSPDVQGDVTLWQIETGQSWRVLKGHTDKVHSIAWSPDGHRLATGGENGTVKLWEPMAGRVLRNFKAPEKNLCLVWSPDKRTLAIGGRLKSTAELVIQLWDTVSGKVLSSSNTKVEEKSGHLDIDLAWTPDGNAIAYIDQQMIIIWDIRSGKLKQFPCSKATALALSADGKVLACGGAVGEIRFYDRVSGKVNSYISHSYGPVNSVSFSPDGRFLATAGKLGTVCLWDTHRWQSLYKRQTYKINARGQSVLAWSPDSTALAIGNDQQNALVILDAQSGTVFDVIQESQEPTSSLAWSPDGSLLATGTGSKNSIVQLWNAKSGFYEALQRLDTHMGPINTVAWSPDSNSLLFAGKDTMINLWQPKTSKQLRRFGDMRDVVYGLAWSPDGKTFASAGNQGIRLWDIQSARARRILKNPSSTSRGVQIFSSIAWSPDGTTLASGDFDGNIQIWDPNSSQPLHSFKACCGRVTSLSWSPDGLLLVSGGDDGTARVWDIRNGYQPYAVLLPLWGSIGPGIAFNPEGDYRGPPGIEEHLIYVVQTDSGQELLTPRKYANRYGWVNEAWQVGLHTPGSEIMGRIYVKADAQGPYDGNSWDTAFNDLQDALNTARPDTEIWVAAGLYKPDRGTGMREASFRLRNGVSILGGFSGADTSRYQRDPNKHETILSGDLKGDDGPDFANSDENSYHVVTADRAVQKTVLDGIIITAGNANGPQEDGHSFGGGMYNYGGHCALVNCNFIGNRSDLDGGGIFSGGSLAISNCMFSDNLA